MDVQNTLLAFSACTGVSGLEAGAAAYAAGLLAPYGAVETTPLGSLLCRVWDIGEGPHLLLDAHMDEIGLIVTHIEEEGFVRVGNCGGMDRRLLTAQVVDIHTGEGPLPGVVCSTPPHLSEGGEKNPKIEELLIDTGLSKEEAESRILPGDRITLRSHPQAMLNGRVSGKALDDRAGCVSLLCALEALEGCAPTCNLSVVFSVMEEVGGQGARTAAHRVLPTHAIAVDVSFAHTPDAQKEKCGELGKGPMIGHAPILSAQMSRRFAQLAKDKEIPHQHEVMSGRTGTNADSIVVAGAGVKAALISIPQKYMHSPIEVVCTEDVENTGRLIAEYIKSFPEGGEAL